MHIPLKALIIPRPKCKDRANFTKIVKIAEFTLKTAIFQNFKDFVQAILFTKYVKYTIYFYKICKSKEDKSEKFLLLSKIMKNKKRRPTWSVTIDKCNLLF